eukprot:Tamp_27706.p1 GENE.Tamp_27706~~Tamp_27706.p1  ORF type:complete len:232 (+),score=24.09 Tamp_27706:109-804(+)
MLTKLATATSLNVLADIVAQVIRHSRQRGRGRWWRELEYLTCVRAFIWALLSTPVIDAWLEFLEAFFGSGTDWGTVALKTSADQLAFGPVLLTSFLLYFGAFQKATTQNYEWKDTLDLIRNELVSMQLSGMAFWLPVSLSLFTVVPEWAQILVINVAGLIYNIGLALQLPTGKVPDAAPPPASPTVTASVSATRRGKSPGRKKQASTRASPVRTRQSSQHLADRRSVKTVG